MDDLNITDCDGMNLEAAVMNRYRLQVRNAAKVDSQEPFENSSKFHARIVAEEFARQAQRDVVIYCGRLSRDVWGGEKLLEIFRDLIECKRVSVRLIVESGVCDSIKLAELIASQGEGYVRYLPEDVRKLYDGMSHYYVIDEKRYRVESDGTVRKAVACANGVKKDMSKRLAQLFENMFTRARVMEVNP